MFFCFFLLLHFIIFIIIIIIIIILVVKGTISRYCACAELWFLDRMSQIQKMRGE